MNASSVPPDDDEAQTPDTSHTVLEVASNVDGSYSVSQQAKLCARLSAWLMGLLGLALEALSCCVQKKMAPSEGSTFSKSHSSAYCYRDSNVTCDDTSRLAYSKPM